MESKQKEVKKRCYNCGFKLKGSQMWIDIFQYVENWDHVTNEPIFNKRMFCSAREMRFYIRNDKLLSPHILSMTECHLRKLGIEDDDTAEDPVVMACYNMQGIGKTREEYQTPNPLERMVENVSALNIRKQCFLSQPQVNRIPLHTLLKSEQKFNNPLYEKLEVHPTEDKKPEKKPEEKKYPMEVVEIS